MADDSSWSPSKNAVVYRKFNHSCGWTLLHPPGCVNLFGRYSGLGRVWVGGGPVILHAAVQPILRSGFPGNLPAHRLRKFTQIVLYMKVIVLDLICPAQCIYGRSSHAPERRHSSSLFLFYFAQYRFLRKTSR